MNVLYFIKYIITTSEYFVKLVHSFNIRFYNFGALCINILIRTIAAWIYIYSVLK